MFIWWGSRVREKELERGSFLCPRCRTQQPYRRVALGRQSTVYSLPVGSFESISEEVECGTCGSRYVASGFGSRTPAGSIEPGSWDCPKCANSNPNDRYQCLKCRYSLV